MQEVGNLPEDVTVIIVTHSVEVVQKCSKIFKLSANGLIGL
jgi:ABC-type lipoprotein export system ATPase subunit